MRLSLPKQFQKSTCRLVSYKTNLDFWDYFERENPCLTSEYRALDKMEYLVIIRDNLSVLHKNICCDPSSEPAQ